MFKFSVQIIILWMHAFIDDSSSKTSLEIDCSRDYTLTKLKTPNKYFTTCPSFQSVFFDSKCFDDCFDDSKTVCYSDALVNEAIADGISFYNQMKYRDVSLLSVDVLPNVTQAANADEGFTQNVFDTSNIIDISVSFLGRSLDGGNDAESSNKAFNHFLHRPVSRCGYNTAEVCNDDIPEDCNNFEKIRTYNGVCNNLKKKTMGAALAPYYSLIHPQYDTIKSNFGAVNSRVMSVFLNSTSRRKYEKTKEIPNLMFMWGFQAFVHEIGFLQDFIMPNDENPLRCCGLNGNRKLPSFFRNRQCMPIYVSSDDPVFDNSVNCLEFTRAQRGHDSCHFAKPRFINAVPTAIDGNIIYGADESTNQQIRDSNSLKFAKDEFGLSIIGDVRSQQTAGFFMFNELFTNLHDMIVTKLEDYEQARKFVSGTMQKILFDLLADALGKSLTKEYDLLNRADCYDPDIPLVTLTEFSHSVGRYAHEFIPKTVDYQYKNGTTATKSFHFVFSKRSIRTIEENRNALLWGMVNRPILRKRVSYVIQNEFPGIHDLFAQDNQREKDAEVEPYIKYLKYYRATCINKFDDLVNFKIMSRGSANLLQRMFKNVNNIPLSMGSRLECLGEESIFPPTNAHITIDQLKRLQCGDRYFWTRKEINSPKTIAAIEKITIKELICCYTKGYIPALPKNSFLTEGPNNPKEKCLCRDVAQILNL